MYRVNELFGKYTNGKKFPDLSADLLNQRCPWSTTSGVCYKTRKSDTDIAIGTCSLCFNHIEQPLLICLSRLKDRNRIFNDCLPFIARSITGSELYLIPEVSTSVGSIDFMLVAAKGQHAIDFVGIELQTLDTTGSIWNFRQRMLKDKGYEVSVDSEGGSVGINWKMTAKTILAQMTQKTELFDSIGKNLVLVCQTPLYVYMEKNFNFSNVNANADMRDVLHFHMYDYIPVHNRMELSLAYTRSASLTAVQKIMGMNKETDVEYSNILATLSRKLLPKYRFQPLS